MMKGHTFVGVTRSCGGVQDLTEDDQENDVKRGSASRSSGKQRKGVIAASTQQKEQEQKCKKRLREQQLELCPAFLDRTKGSCAVYKRARRERNEEGPHTVKSASLQVMEHSQPMKFTRNLEETTTTQTTRGAVTVNVLLITLVIDVAIRMSCNTSHTHIRWFLRALNVSTLVMTEMVVSPAGMDR